MNIRNTRISLAILAVIFVFSLFAKISFAQQTDLETTDSNPIELLSSEIEPTDLVDVETVLITEKNDAEIIVDTDPLFLIEKENVTNNFYHLIDDLESKIDRYKILTSSKTLFSRFQRTLLRQSIRSSIREAGLYLDISKDRSYLDEKNILYFKNRLSFMSDLISS